MKLDKNSYIYRNNFLCFRAEYRSFFKHIRNRWTRQGSDQESNYKRAICTRFQPKRKNEIRIREKYGDLCDK